MISRFTDRIWHIRGSLALAPGQSEEEAFARLAPLFRRSGTSHERGQDRLTFRKKDQAAQDEMAVFDSGVLRIESEPAGRVLHYRLTSRALLFCFLAPLLFLAFGQATVALGKLDKPAAEASDKFAKEQKALPQNPIDKALGAPAPEKPKKDGKEEQDRKSSPTAAYVFAAMFAALYVAGRLIESRRVNTLFRQSLA